MINPDAYYDVAQFLRASDFYIHRNRFIWEAFEHLIEKQIPIDFTTLLGELEKSGRLIDVGGPAYLAGLVNAVPTSLHAEAYGRIIEEMAVRRNILTAANQVARLAYQHNINVDEVLTEAEHVIFSAGDRNGQRDAKPLGEIVSGLYDQVSQSSQQEAKTTGLTTGFTDLDHLLMGLQPGNMIIVAGRTSTGKTSFLLNLARHVAQTHQCWVALFSLEMTESELGKRLITQESGIDHRRLITGKLTDSEWALFTKAVGTISSLQILIDDTSDITPIQLHSKCLRLNAKYTLGLVIVDYLQLMSGGGRFENRQVEVAYISRQIKGLAKSLGVPVLAASQMSRAVEQRNDKTPLLSDLRESGSQEQDADCVIFLHRPDEENRSRVQVTLAKQRNGPTGHVDLVFHPASTRFENTSQHP
ncbi:MAG: replicative DNA helicase [Anaerolineales bacterium]|nr:replicative DNA helicase [Anaerolineales bacterium]